MNLWTYIWIFRLIHKFDSSLTLQMIRIIVFITSNNSTLSTSVIGVHSISNWTALIRTWRSLPLGLLSSTGCVDGGSEKNKDLSPRLTWSKTVTQPFDFLGYERFDRLLRAHIELLHFRDPDLDCIHHWWRALCSAFVGVHRDSCQATLPLKDCRYCEGNNHGHSGA